MFLRNTVTLLLAMTATVSGSAGSLRADPTATAVDDSTPLMMTHEILAEFDAWMVQHSKVYASLEEKMHRMKVWIDNHVRIEEHNTQEPKPTFTLGHNEYSDLTNDEFNRHFNLGGYAQMPSETTATTTRSLEVSHDFQNHHGVVGLPESVNWVALGAVTPVKNQGACGSCWAFSTTGALEGAKFVATGELVTLSEQNLLDCDHTDLGCNGGLMDNAFKFDEKSGGLCSEEDYPYEAKQNRVCRTDCEDVPGTIVKTFYDVPPGCEKAMLHAIALQPISVAIQANQFVFQFYKTGVLTDSSCGKRGDIDHGVLAVGYGTDLETNEPYFLVKNSWGDSWGENGYIRLGRNSDNDFGMCAILKMASYPEVRH